LYGAVPVSVTTPSLTVASTDAGTRALSNELDEAEFVAGNVPDVARVDDEIELVAPSPGSTGRSRGTGTT
jgi:hypothetical protein